MAMNQIKLYASKAIEFFGDAFSEARDTALDDSFLDGIEIGISATISSLYESGVAEDKIINLLNKYWDIPRQEAISRINHEKTQLCIRELKEYFILQGWSSKDIESYFGEQLVGIKIRHNKELWGLWNNPKKLKHEIEKLQK